MQTLAERLRYVRKPRGRTQQELVESIFAKNILPINLKIDGEDV